MTVDLKTQLHVYFDYVDDLQGAVDLDAIPPFDGPVELALARRPRSAPGRAFGFAAIAVIALIGGMLWLVRSDRAPSTAGAPVSTAVTPTTNGTVTTAVLGGTDSDSVAVDTSLGVWTWVRVATVENPPNPWLPAYPAAYVDGEFVTSDGGFQVSADGFSWSPGPAPAGADEAELGNVEYLVGGDAVYATLVGSAGIRLWRYGFGTWTELDLPELEFPDAEGLSLGPRLGSVLVAGATVVVIVEFEDQLLYDPGISPLSDHYGLDASVGEIRIVENPPSGPLELWVEGESEPRATIELTIAGADPPSVEFRDSGTNELIHVIRVPTAEMSANELRAAVASQDAVIHLATYFSKSDGHFDEVSLPFGWTDAMSRGDFELKTLDGDLLAWVNGRVLWRSSDGVVWDRVDGTRLPAASEDSGAVLTGAESRVFLGGYFSDTTTQTWTSTDGHDWEVVPDLNGEERPRISETAFGWLAITGDRWDPSGTGARKVLVSRDGLAWEEIEAPFEICRAVFVAETIFGFSCFDAGYDIWVATLGDG